MLITDERWYSDIAGAIRALAVCSETYAPSQMADAITNLPIATNMAYVADLCAEHKIEGFPYIVGMSASFITSSFLSGNSVVTVVKYPKVASVYDNAFSGCVNLNTVALPRCEYVGSEAFRGCTSLSEIGLPLCSLVSTRGFAECTGLATAVLPQCVSIGSSAFISCTHLTSLYLTSVSKVVSLGTSAFYSTPMLNSSLTGSFGSIYVPESLYSSFRVAYQWSTMSNRFVAV